MTAKSLKEKGFDIDLLLKEYEDILFLTGDVKEANMRVLALCEESDIKEVDSEEVLQCIQRLSRRNEMRQRMKNYKTIKSIRAIEYEKGMEDGFIERYYDDDDVDGDVINTSSVIGKHKIKIPYIIDDEVDFERKLFLGKDHVIVEIEDGEGNVETLSMYMKNFERKYVEVILKENHPMMTVDTISGDIKKIPELPQFWNELLTCPEDGHELSWIDIRADKKGTQVIGECSKCNSSWKFSVEIEEYSDEGSEIEHS